MVEAAAGMADALDFGLLELLRTESPAWRLLRSHNVAMVASFLDRAFVAGNGREIPQAQLQGQLESYLDLIRSGSPDEGVFTRSAQEYLDEWADDDHGWLRKYYPRGHDDACYDLTPQAQKAIEWLHSMMPQTYIGFVGTESRLHTVFDLVQQIVDDTESDPEARIAILQRQKEDIDEQIAAVRSGQAVLLNPTQVRERVAQAISTARSILVDFREVEQNFRALDQQMREKVSTWDAGKGELLEEIFASHDSISGSEQGRSFAAFWSFVMSPSSQERFQANLDSILQMDHVLEMGLPGKTRDIQNDWIKAGSYVQNTVAQLNGQLRRYVDENFLEEERRMLTLIRNVERKALARRNDPPRGWQMPLDDAAPRIELPMDRPLFSPPKSIDLVGMRLEPAEADVPLNLLFDLVYVDKDELQRRVDTLLASAAKVPLSAVLEEYPLELGLSELVCYVELCTKAGRLDVEFGEEAGFEWVDEDGVRRIARMREPVFVTGSRSV